MSCADCIVAGSRIDRHVSVNIVDRVIAVAAVYDNSLVIACDAVLDVAEDKIIAVARVDRRAARVIVDGIVAARAVDDGIWSIIAVVMHASDNIELIICGVDQGERIVTDGDQNIGA